MLLDEEKEVHIAPVIILLYEGRRRNSVEAKVDMDVVVVHIPRDGVGFDETTMVRER